MKLLYIMSIIILVFTSCATNTGPEYSASSYNEIKTIKYGVILDERGVVIKDNGLGTFLGAISGAVLGSLVGSASGKTLATLGGGLAGMYVGDKAGEANAEELTVKLDDGESVVVVAKGDNYKVGDRVKIITDGNRVAAVENMSR
jgi:outer membrane lipoprotein SlyB